MPEKRALGPLTWLLMRLRHSGASLDLLAMVLRRPTETPEEEVPEAVFDVLGDAMSALYRMGRAGIGDHNVTYDDLTPREKWARDSASAIHWIMKKYPL
jgi:hypothetical protein